MALVNALYFKYPWSYQFDEKLTKKEPFYGEDKTVMVDMMHRTIGDEESIPVDVVEYMENEVFEAIALPYRSGGYSMYIFLPKKDRSFDELIGHLQEHPLGEIRSHALQSTYDVIIHLALPRFKVEWGSKDIFLTLRSLGLSLEFEMIEPRDYNEIGVMHKAVVEVNERGTEAAAATAAYYYHSHIEKPPKEIDFIVNRPFLFAIVDNSTNAILFLGQINEMEEAL